MMLLERWAVAAILGFGLVATASAHGQSQAPKPSNPPAEAKPEDEPAPSDEPADYVPGPLPPDPAAPAAAAPAPPPAAPAPLPAAPPPAQVPAAPTPVPAPAAPARVFSSDPAQQQLEKDSDHLLQLVQALKLEVEKAGSNTLSLTALRDADEIQRLAKSLKERMREREQAPANKP